MKKSTIIWLIVAAILTLSGALLFTGAMNRANWDFSSLSTTVYDTNTHEITNRFNAVSIKVSTANVTILPSEDEICRVVCVEERKVLHNVTVNNGILKITEDDTRKWYEYLGINTLGESSITIYLPKRQYNFFTVSGSTCDVSIDNLAINELKCKITTGDVSLSNVNCKGNITLQGSTGKAVISNTSLQSLTSIAGTGDITLENVVAKEKIDISRSTGDVDFI